MNQTIKTSVGVAIIIIIGITVGAFTFYWTESVNKLFDEEPIKVKIVKKAAVQQTKPSGQQNIPATVAVAGWKTYENSKYGFAIQYPNEMRISDEFDYVDPASLKKNNLDMNSLVDPATAKNNDIYFTVSIIKTSFDKNINSETTDRMYSLEISKIAETDINSWFANWKKQIERPSNYEGSIINPKVISSEPFKIGNINGIKSAIDQMPYLDSSLDFIYKGNLYSFANGNSIGSESDIAQGRKYFNEMIKTIKLQ
jgi:hypothetical protein